MDLILGTAGHIDHGKSALVRALTGVDPDRLPEEKKRGITIELGFAELVVDEFRFGIVDVPGHERFVRQMLAGATGMDLVMLVVAADDSVKPQTREHVDVLRLLDLRGGVIVLTKCDLADPDWIPLVEAEVRELVQGTPLADAPVIRTSVKTGEGIETLKTALRDAARRLPPLARSEANTFHMPVDRVFTLPGFGTVVTGSVASGTLRLGDMLDVAPLGLSARVRNLQHHDREVQEVHRGQRAAVNLAGIHHAQLVRGYDLASPGYLVPAKCVTAWLHLLPQTPRPLKDRAKVRLHLGAAEWGAVVRTLEGNAVRPGETAWVQLHVAQPIVSLWNQPFVIRQESPATTLGGGRVVVPDAMRMRSVTDEDLAHLRDLKEGEPRERVASAIYFAAHRAGEDGSSYLRLAGVPDAAPWITELCAHGSLLRIMLPSSRSIVVHRDQMRQWKQRVLAFLENAHRLQPLATLIDRAQILQAFAYLGEPALVQAILESVGKEGIVRFTDRGVGLTARQPKLSAARSSPRR